MTRLFTSVAAAALLALPALAQAPTTNNAPNANQGKPPSPAAESTMQKAPDASRASDMTQKPAAGAKASDATAKLDAADRNFVETAASSGMAEVEAGKMAGDKARNGQVKDFAKMMVDDHTKANDKLMAWAKQNGVEVPKDLKAEHKTAASKLSSASGAQFDRIYMDNQVNEHQKAVQLFTKQSNSGQNPELKQFAAQTLPTLQQHLKQAQQIAADLNKTAASDKSATGAKSTADHKSAARSGRARSTDTTMEQGSTDRDLGTTEPSAGKQRTTAKSGQRGDAESARVAELNRQQLQRLEGQGSPTQGSPTQGSRSQTR